MGSSQARDRTRVLCIGRWILNHCATREVPFCVFWYSPSIPQWSHPPQIFTTVIPSTWIILPALFPLTHNLSHYLFNIQLVYFFGFLNFIYFLYSRFLLVIYFILLVYICQSLSPNSSHHHHPPATFPPWCPYVCSLHLRLCFCPANRFNIQFCSELRLTSSRSLFLVFLNRSILLNLGSHIPCIFQL